jgi:hypothetical protein
MVEFGQLAAVAGVLTLLGLTLGFLRRRGLAGLTMARSKPARRLECLERLPLGPASYASSGADGRNRAAGGIVTGRLLVGAELSPETVAAPERGRR